MVRAPLRLAALMRASRASGGVPLGGPLTGLGLGLGLALGGLASLVAAGAVLVHRCVSGDGLSGWLGLRLAVLHADVDCPSGVAVGADGRQVAVLVVMVTVPVLLAHLLGAGVGLGLVAQVRRVLRGVVGALSGVLPRPAATHRPLLADRTHHAGQPWRPSAEGLRQAPRRRGPPALAPA